jgi:beta-lactamase superfamily II metal-dependent hydrolase
MFEQNMWYTEAVDCGDGNYVIAHDEVTKEEYKKYLYSLEENGFEKIVDNGNGLAGVVFTGTYRKGKWALTVIYVERQKKMYVSACYDQPISERLFYKDEYTAENKPDAKTKLYMCELWWFGNSFVIQLKNGHFIISDGGQTHDSAYLIDFLESFVPENEKPVVEAWLISHAHGDHCGVFRGMIENGALLDRIFVEGIYYSVIGEEFYEKDEPPRIDVAYMKWASKRLRAADGSVTKFYRPHTGERYYFSDITVDVVHTQEQLPRNAAIGDNNFTSTWFMLTIEGQKCLFTGDGDRSCMRTLMATYDQEYLDVDVMTLMHHGFDTRDEFTDYCKVKTVLLTVRDSLPVGSANENTYLKEHIEESFAWGDGTKVLTFPYTVGSYETLPKRKWIYHDESTRIEQINIHRYGGGHEKKEIRTLRMEDNGLKKQAELLLQSIYSHLKLPFTEDGQMIELKIDTTIDNDTGYRIRMEDPTGWVLRAINEEKLEQAIEVFVEDAVWSDKGFTAKQKK